MSSTQPVTTTEMDAFKQDLRLWFEMDATIRALQANLRQRRLEHRLLTQRMVAFMAQHGMDDIKSPWGSLRFHVSYVKPPVSQQTLLQRITDFFQNDVIAAQQLRSALLGSRNRTERASLRRISS
jgi:hypothetical protein